VRRSGILTAVEPLSRALCLGLICVLGIPAQTERVIYSFGGVPDGYYPLAPMIADAAGNLYGTASQGGSGCGTVFELKRGAHGFTESVIWAFDNSDPTAGCAPYGGLVYDTAGNLYGTTAYGGTGSGAAFELSPTGGGGWTEKLLWSFGGTQSGAQDGIMPVAGLAIDKAGNLYGTTLYGGGPVGSDSCGTAFQLSPQADRTWSEKVIHSFGSCAGSTDGLHLFTGVTLDDGGNVYGTTNLGGLQNSAACNFGCGTVFKLDRAKGWKETQLYVFQGGGDGANPYGPVIFTAAGHLLGTADSGGNGDGVVFELTTSGTLTVIHSFGENGQPNEGAHPNGGLTAHGNHYYGTTEGQASPGSGCTVLNCGAVYELTRTAIGWTYTALSAFGPAPDASFNDYFGGGLTLGAAGTLFGTTSAGGANGLGAVFQIIP